MAMFELVTLKMSGSTRLENANPLIFERIHLIRSINDPEHPLSLEELNVVEQVRVRVNDPESAVSVEFTPTIPHCSMATLIGLSIKIDVHITPGTHASEEAVNKQLADKERVAAALENSQLLEVVNQCLSSRTA
ncbi:mitotic spindle-associated MMXD complex subunit MIP18-like [Scleropages formosus]|uniref:Cytosolic iron-sulfur assembly component 2B n=1 Tax=Scleropages formosus TaxID=113540 RepID=A0A0P7Y5P8_SCLFO|nr:mitotic spindle-associated MMXD complex subunit MIP18-like [Scleropages formosus]